MATREIFPGDLEEVRAYSRRLRSYSTDELEDIYFHIHIVKQPVHYRLLMRELEARRVRPVVPTAVRSAPDLRCWIAGMRCLDRAPWLRPVLAAMLLTVAACGVTVGLLAPIWLFAMPLQFIGLQTSIVYLACAPIAPVMAMGVGARLGGRGINGIFVLAGVALGLYLFHLTGAPAAIMNELAEPIGSRGGWSMGGF